MEKIENEITYAFEHFGDEIVFSVDVDKFTEEEAEKIALSTVNADYSFRLSHLLRVATSFFEGRPIGELPDGVIVTWQCKSHAKPEHIHVRVDDSRD